MLEGHACRSWQYINDDWYEDKTDEHGVQRGLGSPGRRHGFVAQHNGRPVDTGLVYHPVRANRTSDWSTAATT